jgi:superfamily II DNA/RNA helicase
MRLRKPLLDGIFRGFDAPLPFQQRAIPAMVSRRDVLAQASGVTGKTVALCISVLQNINISHHVVQALILVPTDEQVFAIEAMLMDLSNCKIKCCDCLGGVNSNVYTLTGFQVIIGTPDCMCHLIEQDRICTKDVVMCVVDEATRICRGQHRYDIDAIFDHMPEDTQFVFLSATTSKELVAMSKTWMRNPIRILDGVKPLA